MAFRHIAWTEAALHALSQYPRKCVKEIADELEMHPTTISRKLRLMGHTVRHTGGKRRRMSVECS